jgi:hypothetical protein
MDEELYNINPTVMSKALRRKQQMGTLGMLSGDPVLAPLGENLGEQAGSEAWRDTQEGMQRRGVLARALEEKADREFRGMETKAQRDWMGGQNDMDRGLARSIAQLRADSASAGSKKYRNFTAKNIQELNEQTNIASNMDVFANSFKDDYARIAAPGGRDAANWMASKGMGTENAEAAQQWWASWDRIYTLPVRNEMFGSALTDTEKEAWAKANISTDMTPAQIRSNLKIITDIKNKAMTKLGGNLKAANFDPEAVDYIFGGGFEKEPESSKGYSMGDQLEYEGKAYRVIGGTPEDPELELVE